MISVRKAEERGHDHCAWLDAFHTFAAAQDVDAGRGGFRALRVIDEDRVAGGGEFGMHPHRDMEILTYVLSGALQHRDSLGHVAVMKAGEIQRISAGSGIEHSEANYSRTEPVRFLQFWIMPEVFGLPPDYQFRSFVDAAKAPLTLVASRDGRESSIPIQQDVDVSLGKLNGHGVEYKMRPGRGVWLQVTDGALQANGKLLREGDGAALTEEGRLDIEPMSPAHFLLFDLV